MSRINFTVKVRDKIAASAGHQCSFPACNRRTIGPGPKAEFVSNSGYAAHIYSASSGGPRGQGALSVDELKGPGNGIWLCGRHAKLVDNNKGTSYPPETLLSYKALHEARVLLEHEGLYPPMGWLHELVILQGPLFSTPQTVQFAKLNLIYGKNSTGKTAITEWVFGFFDSNKLKRWSNTNRSAINLALSLLSPKLQNLKLTVENGEVRYSIDGKSAAFIPIGFRVFKPKVFDHAIADDVEMLSHALGVSAATVNALVEEINNFPHAKVQNLKWGFATDDEGNILKERRLIADVDGTCPGLPLLALSGREQERVLIEFSSAAARLSGKYCPTLLILDECISIIFEGFFDYYSHHLLAPINQFQTFLCIPERDLDLENVRWNGWQVIRTEGKSPNITLAQDLRVKNA